MLYCVNNHCSLPLHIALADVIDSCCGSTEVLSIHNRLGDPSSKDTLEHFQVAKASEMKAMVLSDCDRPGAFCHASIDDIDKNSQFAAVYANQDSLGFIEQLFMQQPLLDLLRMKVTCQFHSQK